MNFSIVARVIEQLYVLPLSSSRSTSRLRLRLSDIGILWRKEKRVGFL
jgi:hypothetical protein